MLGMKREILIILISSFLVGLSYSIYQPIWPFLVREAGVDAATYGVIASGANLIEFVLRWTFAAFASPYMTFLVGSLGVSLSSGLLLMGASPITIFSSLALLSMGRALHIMGRNQITSLLFKGRKGTAFGSIRVSWQVGMIVGPALGLFAALVTGNLVLLLGLFLGLLSFFLITPMIREFGVRGRGKVTFWRGSLTPKIKGVIALTILNNFARDSFLPFHLVVAPLVFGVGVEHVAIAAMIERLTSTFFGIPVGWLSDRISDKRIILALSELFMAMGVSIYVVPSTGMGGFLLSAFLLGLGISSYAPVITAAVSEMAPRNPQDAVAFLSTSVSLSRLPAPLVTSALIAAFNYHAAFGLSVALLSLVGICMALSSLKIKEGERG